MKTNAPTTVLTVLLTAVPALLHAVDPVVTDVVSAQRAGTKLVDITFDLADADSDQVDISIQVSDDAGVTFIVPGIAVSGDTSVNATPTPTGYALVWNAGIDFNQQFDSDMVVRVIADDGTSPVPLPDGMVLVPEGEFEMGYTTNSFYVVHSVFVSAFYIERFEVTKELWDEVKAYADANGYGFDNPGSGRGRFHPAVRVNWWDAVKWCNARSEKEGLTPVYHTDATRTVVFKTGQIHLAADFVDWSANGYRLPTEAEWEKAARGGAVETDYPWGDTIAGGDANYNGSGDPFESPPPDPSAPVGFYDGGQEPAGPDRVNGYGLYDVAGNAPEWCWDRYDVNWYSQPGATAPDTRGPATSSTGEDRILRGGGWGSSVNGMLCASRQNRPPIFHFFNSGFGFRCVRGR